MLWFQERTKARASGHMTHLRVEEVYGGVLPLRQQLRLFLYFLSPIHSERMVVFGWEVYTTLSSTTKCMVTHVFES